MGPVLVISGLPPTGSWQDLKDHMREAGDVCFADVQRDGEGVVEFLRREDMEYALRRLDGTEFRSHQVTHSNPETLNILIPKLCIYSALSFSTTANCCLGLIYVYVSY